MITKYGNQEYPVLVVARNVQRVDIIRTSDDKIVIFIEENNQIHAFKIRATGTEDDMGVDIQSLPDIQQ